MRNGRWRGVGHKHIRKAEEASFKPNFSFFTSLSTAETHVCGVKFIEFYGTVGFIEFGTFPFEERAICGVTSGQRSMKWFAFPSPSFRRRDNDFE